MLRRNPLSLYSVQSVKRFLVISKGTEYIRIPAEQLVYISADGNYSEIVMHDGRKHVVTFQLGQLESMLERRLGKEKERFIRIGRSLIINIDFFHSIDTAKQQIVLSDCCGCYYDLKASREVLVSFKAYLEALDENE